MPYLFCEADGREDLARTIASEATYRDAGETVLIVSGKLKRDGLLCYRCNAPLCKGSVAYMHSAYPEPFADTLSTYDFASERQYFYMRYIAVHAYGAHPLGGAAVAEAEQGSL